MSKKFDSFIECLELLCRQHGVQIAVGCCDGLDIYDLEEGEHFLLVNGVVDFTKSEEDASRLREGL